MIRVNLLPIKQARRRSQGRAQLFLFAGLIIVEVLALFAFYLVVSEDRDAKQTEVAALQEQVREIEQEVSEAERLQEEKAALEARRIGPVRMLDEIQAMLSPPRNEEERVNQLRREWNVDWDTRRLWVEQFTEGGGEFQLNGFAGSHDDVAEFLQRMTTARYFFNVELEVVERAGGGRGRDGARLVQFRIHGELSYTGHETETAAEDS
jgi:type IV pilus assembly protein PilN